MLIFGPPRSQSQAASNDNTFMPKQAQFEIMLLQIRGQNWLSMTHAKSNALKLSVKNEKRGQSLGTKHGTMLIFCTSQSQSRAASNDSTFIQK